MRKTADRNLIVLAIALSAALTALTVWAVARQGWALQEREWSDLKSTATAVAAQRNAQFRADLQRALETADRAWETGGPDGLDGWALGQRVWLIAGCLDAGGTWHTFPRTPLEQRLPPPADDATADDAAAPGDEAPGPTTYIEQLARTADPLARAGMLFAAAVYEQQLGNPLAAARIFAEVAHLLRTTPGLAQFAFRAELARVESLLAAGDREQAREALRNLVGTLHADHPFRLGLVEVGRLRRLADTLKVDDAETLATHLAELECRARRRGTLATAVSERVRAWRTQSEVPPGEHELLTLNVDEPVLVAMQPTADGVCLAIATPVTVLLQRYWQPAAPGTSWRVRPPGAVSDLPVLVNLSPGFAGALLEPSVEAADRLRSVARRRVTLMAATAAGTVGAWGLVIWALTRVVRRQRELVRLQRRFVADVSHELKTPLALIRLLAETLAEQRVSDAERTRNYLQTITRESERLSFLLDSILDFSRMESGRKVYEFSDCDVARVARQAWSLFEPQFAAQEFESHLEIADDLPIIKADARALEQVLVNLLQNAHRYAGDGKYVRLSLMRDGYLIVIAVEDHGIGMSRKILERLGDSFVRGDDTRVRQMRGAGLGLTIVNHIVTAHRGKLEVHSRPGQGSTFTVWIPFEPQ